MIKASSGFLGRLFILIALGAAFPHNAAAQQAMPDASQPGTVPDAPAPTPDAEMDIPPAFEDKPIAILQALDKITARVSEFRAPVNQEVAFGSLKITVRACKKAPPIEQPEAAAFIQILEQKRGEKIVSPVFSGWMFASSPALSAMEHPVYDIWVKDCIQM